MTDLPTDMPTVLIDSSTEEWFAWVHNPSGEDMILGSVTSLPGAVAKANKLGVPCGYVYWVTKGGPISTVGMIKGSYQQVNK